MDFITKPVQREELLARVQTHLELRRLRVRLEQQADGLRQVNAQLQEELAERRRAEEALREAERKYRAIFDNAIEGIYQTTPTGAVVTANPALACMLGFTSADDLIREFKDVSRQSYVNPAARQEFIRRIEAQGRVTNFEYEALTGDRRKIWVSENARAVRDPQGRVVCYEGSMIDITARKRTEAERDQLIQDLQCALANVKSLSGLLPICAGCKKIRDDQGYWNQVESYIQKHTDARFSHGLCPDCLRKWYPEIEHFGLANQGTA